MTIGMPLLQAKAALVRCRSYSPHDIACDFKNDRVADLPTLDTYANFTDKKLSSISFEWPTIHYEAVRNALVQAYGPPCKVDRKILQNGFGATFSGDEVSWCFAEGEFQLRRYGSNNNTEVLFEHYDTSPAKTYSDKTL
jgi:hypothetical protein